MYTCIGLRIHLYTDSSCSCKLHHTHTSQYMRENVIHTYIHTYTHTNTHKHTHTHTFSPPTAAAVVMMGALENFVQAKVFRIRLVTFSNFAARSSSGMQSILFSTMIMESVVISPITMHSAVWVWMPLLASITRIIMSMIWAPPMIVRMREAWPGQSTRVNWE